MHIKLIRNATMRIEYGGRLFVTDPYLAAKHAMPSYTGASPNPLVELPGTPEEVLEGIEMALISHLHSDHFDPAARGMLPKTLPIVCQPGDVQDLAFHGFTNLLPADDVLVWEGISIERIGGQHGSGDVLSEMGDASGFVLTTAGEPTIYWIGDTVWCRDVEETIARVQPDIIITHSGGAMWGDRVLIIMDAEQTVSVCRAAPRSTVVAVHMEALDHLTVTRQELRRYAESHGIAPDRLLIPQDGAILSF